MKTPAHTQATIGILMLESRFPRILGDIGNPNTWSFPVLTKTVVGATPDQVIHHRAKGLLSAFTTAAQELVLQGADGITTSCGFLALFQDDLALAVDVPVVSSSLQQVSWLQTLLPKHKNVGILTICKSALRKEQLTKAGVPNNTPIIGTENGQEFSRVILNNEPELDVDLARKDILMAGKQLIDEYPNTGAIVLECTNMAPYAAELNVALGIPVYSIYDLINWFQAGLRPHRFIS